MKRKLAVFLGLVLLLAILPATVLAGGWASITLDAWPNEVVAGRPVEVGFIVRQHGHDDQRMNDLTPTVSIRNPESGEAAAFPAEREGEPGHYVAELVFPSAGSWEWTVAAFTMEQPMPALTVGEAQALTQARPPASRGVWLAAGGLGMALLAGAAVLWRKRRPWAVALAVAGLAIAGVGMAAASSGAAAQPVSVAGATPAAELGEALFVAKGCVQCHANGRIDRRLVAFSTETGPSLTSYQASPEFVRMWLKDPRSVKTQTEMPDLGLSEVEIEALIAFLKSGDG